MSTDLERVAAVVLVRQGRVLLAHRRPDRRWYPDCWDLIGGHVEPGETPRDAAARECAEEIGVTVTRLGPVPMATGDASMELHAFVATSWHGEPANLATDEHDDLRWFRPDELGDLDLADPAYLPDLHRIVTPEA